ncbi:MAG: hyaluronate lyase, partial [Pyrobaculum sp.]
GTKIDRRGFIKLLGFGGALAAVDWARAVKLMAETVAKGEVNIVWFEAQDCAGNTTAIIQAVNPDLVEVLGGFSHVVGPGTVKLLFHETIMPEWGEAALDILRAAIEGKLDPFVLVLEGSLPIDEKAGGPPGSDLWCFIGEEGGKPISCMEWIRRLLPRAAAVVSVGNCASYGGVVANKVVEEDFYKKMGFNLFDVYPKEYGKSPTGAVGFFDDPRRGIKGAVHLLKEAEPFRRFVDGMCTPQTPGQPDCRPAVAVPGCPANGDGQLKTLANLVLWVKGLLPLPPLDEFYRPKFIFGETVHERCPRAAFYAVGDFRQSPGDNDPKCLWAVGCKGPISHCPWNRVGWVNGVGGPTRTGAVCIGCTEPGFTDSFEPFYAKLPYVGVSREVLTNATLGILAAAAVAGVASGLWSLKRHGEEKGKSGGM